MEFNQRLRKLKDSCDAVLIVNFESSPDPNFFWLTNSEVNGIFYYDFQKATLLTSQMELQRAGKSWVKDVRQLDEKFFANLKGTVGVNKQRLSVAIHEKIKTKTKNISRNLYDARVTKTSYEIQQLKKACNITKQLWPKIEAEASGATEIELKGIIEQL